MSIQRRAIIQTTKDTEELSRKTEVAMEELKGMIERHSVQNFVPSDPNNNLQYLDEDNNILYVYNTTSKKWTYTNMTEV